MIYQKELYKLIQDFATSITNDETQKQYLLQVVEQQRKAVPNFNKDTVNNLWSW